MELGSTHYGLDADVLRVANRITTALDGVTWNTYHNHPWPGWDGRSVDFWGALGRGFAISRDDARNVLAWLVRRQQAPFMRHWIYRHQLWTSFGGYSHWAPNDHSGDLRHVHVTFWP